jgi:hypothetical protein
MTMTRNELAKALADLKPQADGYTRVEFASPKLVQMARADRGHIRMTPVEYATHRLGRKAIHPSMVEDLRVRLAEGRRRQRVATARILAGPGRRRARVERRITGLVPGTKRPITWDLEAPERETKRVH